jgi:DNA (cytosine-5)-methyltransferase 1
MEHKYPYIWSLKDTVFTKDKGKVFSCFACGGGSSMGYKLAGFDVIGCNEIDKKMMAAYVANHNPKYAYLEPIQTFKDRDDLPEELYNLDILDGSPPCSTFSMAGSREDVWGVEKKFREGQSEQVLDTLFFDFIDLAKKLCPKVVISENVKGILLGNAIEYVRNIYDAFDKAGYYCQHFLLDASKMGVPQKRERVFFICLRKDLAKPLLKQVDFFTQLPILKMEFNETSILWEDIIERGICQREVKGIELPYLWTKREKGDNDFSNTSGRVNNKPNKYFNYNYIYSDKVSNTITAKRVNILFDECRYQNDTEVIKCSTFPSDYNFLGLDINYLCGMSVPPIMMAQIASKVYEQGLSKL